MPGLRLAAGRVPFGCGSQHSADLSAASGQSFAGSGEGSVARDAFAKAAYIYRSDFKGTRSTEGTRYAEEIAMHPTPEQIEFIRRHGITHCLPSPQIEMPWRSSRHYLATERDIILNFAQFEPMDDYRLNGRIIPLRKYWPKNRATPRPSRPRSKSSA